MNCTRSNENYKLPLHQYLDEQWCGQNQRPIMVTQCYYNLLLSTFLVRYSETILGDFLNNKVKGKGFIIGINCQS